MRGESRGTSGWKRPESRPRACARRPGPGRSARRRRSPAPRRAGRFQRCAENARPCAPVTIQAAAKANGEQDHAAGRWAGGLTCDRLAWPSHRRACGTRQHQQIQRQAEQTCGAAQAKQVSRQPISAAPQAVSGQPTVLAKPAIRVMPVMARARVGAIDAPQRGEGRVVEAKAHAACRARSRRADSIQTVDAPGRAGRARGEQRGWMRPARRCRRTRRSGGRRAVQATPRSAARAEKAPKSQTGGDGQCLARSCRPARRGCSSSTPTTRVCVVPRTTMTGNCRSLIGGRPRLRPQGRSMPIRHRFAAACLPPRASRRRPRLVGN